MTSIASPTAPLPTTTDASSKRQKFTLTRARDLDARVDAIALRANQALIELDAVGINARVEENSPIRQQLQQVSVLLEAVVESTSQAKGKSSQILYLLESL